MEKPPVVAIINTSPDIVDMLRIAFEQAGIAVISTYTHAIRDGVVDLESLMRQHEPKVIVYDIAPPYPNNWLLFQHVASLPVMQGRQFILTTTNQAQVEKFVTDAKLPVFEVVGTPFNLEQLTSEVHQALRARPVR